MRYSQEVLDPLVAAVSAIIGERLTGVYLHGSLAMGCFHPKKSDIDIIIVIEDGITDRQKMELMKRIVDLNSYAPEKGLEISVIQRAYCSPFVYPTPFELHFSPMHLQWFRDDPQGYVENMRGEDTDLAAHITMIQQYGVVLCGEPVGQVFAEVPRADYTDSICRDVEQAGEDIVEEPVYMILNLCRVLAFLREGLYLSKKDGAAWGVDHLPAEYHALITEAQACYADGRDMQVKPEAAELFAEEMLRLIGTYRR